MAVWGARAFDSLQWDRMVTMGGLGGIPFTALDTYARRHHLTDAEFDTLQRLIRAADAEQVKKDDVRRTGSEPTGKN